MAPPPDHPPTITSESGPALKVRKLSILVAAFLFEIVQTFSARMYQFGERFDLLKYFFSKIPIENVRQLLKWFHFKFGAKCYTYSKKHGHIEGIYILERNAFYNTCVRKIAIYITLSFVCRSLSFRKLSHPECVNQEACHSNSKV